MQYWLTQGCPVSRFPERPDSRLAAGIAMLFALALPVHAKPGDLDPTFGNGGKVITPVGNGNDIATSVVVQSDGKIIVAGSSNNGSNTDFALARYTASGALDTSFGTGGKVATPVGVYYDYGESVALQSDGKIVVAGHSQNVTSKDDFALVRYNDDGSLDTTFGGSGEVTTDFGSTWDAGYAVAVQNDQKIVVAGYSSDSRYYDFALARYNTDGSLDTSFGAGGKVTTVVSGDSVAIQDDGKIVVAGRAGDGFGLVRYMASGALDTSFGTDGRVTTSIARGNSHASEVAVQSDGRIVVAGVTYDANYDFAVVRYTESGALDTSFGTSGKVVTDIGGRSNFGRSVAVDGAGRIIVAGTSSPPNLSTSDIALVRYTASGALDTSFGAGGKVTTNLGGDESGDSVALQRDGKIVVAVGPGFSSSEIRSYFRLLRYEGTPEPEIAVEHPAGTALADDGSAISFGTVSLGGSSAAKTLTIKNAGASGLTLGALTMEGATPADFIMDIASMATTVPPDGSTAFTVTFTPGGSGPRTAVLHITSNDSDENPFDIILTGNPAPGEIDSGFGTVGKVASSVGSGGDIGTGVTVQSDGKIVVAGYSFTDGTADFSLVRFSSGGRLDTSFGNGGKVTTPVGSGDDNGQCVALQSDGKIVIAGYSSNGSNDDFALVRYTASGEVDLSFGTDGKVVTPIGSGDDYGWSIALQSDGKILVAGESYRSGTGVDIAVVRYTSGGALDMNFGSGGKVIIDIGGANNDARGMVLQSDGKIVVAGSAFNGVNNDFSVVRYNTDGTLDTGFGDGGKVITRIGSGDDTGRCVVLQSDGKIVVAGYTWNGRDNDFALVRYNADGTLDTSFGSGGAATTPVGSSYDEAASVAVQRDGKILVAGYSSNGGNDDFALVRYTASGALDASFGPGGKVTTDIGNGDNYGRSVALQADGAILVAGFSYGRDSFLSSFSLVRYLGDPPLSSIESWRLGWFGGPDNSGNAADLADPNGNSIVNLLEYALGGDPVGNTTGRSILPQGAPGDGNRLQFSFTRTLDRPDLTLTVSAADSLTGPWTPLVQSTAGTAFDILVPGATVSEGGTGETRNVIVTDLYPMSSPANPRRFMRLKAER